ncbi:hypothetical protein LA080_007212 [Diaporthe eres]|nr:hypothetical protein LA080_007212 [Diaporthe eres]
MQVPWARVQLRGTRGAQQLGLCHASQLHVTKDEIADITSTPHNHGPLRDAHLGATLTSQNRRHTRCPLGAILTS